MIRHDRASHEPGPRAVGGQRGHRRRPSERQSADRNEGQDRIGGIRSAAGPRAELFPMRRFGRFLRRFAAKLAVQPQVSIRNIGWA